MFGLAITLLLGFFLRITGLNWDQGQHLHPDERFLTLVAEKVSIPLSIAQYFDGSASPLSPYNNGFTFYVYGDLPLLITRLTAELFQMTTYDSIFIVGRVLSSLFDVATIALVYFLALQLFSNKKIALFSSLAYCLAVLPIQQAHFFTTDSFLVFFSTTSLLFFVKYFKQKKAVALMISGVFFGLSLACKTSLIITAPLFYGALVLAFIQKPDDILKRFFVFTICWVLIFRIFQPYAFDGLFSFNPNFVSNIKVAHQMITGEINYPPNVQWTGTLPLIHPFIQLSMWGFGPVATVFAIAGAVILMRKRRELLGSPLMFLTLFSIVIFVYQGVQLAKYMRYFYPIYPFLAVLTGYAVFKASKSRVTVAALVVLMMIWPLFFLSIYQSSHSRVRASDWIYQNVPKGSTITSEEWDDSLPLNISGRTNQGYVLLSLPMFQDDSRTKWIGISKQLSQADFVILSSNRVLDAVKHRPTVYPTTNLYYQRLFDGTLGFRLIKKITSFPSIGPLSIDDSWSEESFTVYDHPQIYIFKKVSAYTQDDIMKLLFLYE